MREAGLIKQLSLLYTLQSFQNSKLDVGRFHLNLETKKRKVSV
jgi:hypothetical protein